MVTFLTFFLGLTVGVHSVEVAVDRSVAAVELRFDGELRATLERTPWRVPTGEVDGASTFQWDLRKVLQDPVRWRLGAGSMPCALRMFPTVVSEMR